MNENCIPNEILIIQGLFFLSWGHIFQKGYIYFQNANSFSQLNKKSWKHLYVNFSGKGHESLSKYTALHSAYIYYTFMFLFNHKYHVDGERGGRKHSWYDITDH